MAPLLKRLILHVGPHKTGTTSLQHHLATQRQALRQQGFVVPPILSLDNTPNNWYLVYVACCDNERLAKYHNSVRGGHQPADCAKLRERFTQTLDKELHSARQQEPLGEQQAIFSSEEVAFLRSDDWDHLYKLFLTHAERIELVYYLRAPIDRLRSDLQQGVKGGTALTAEIFSKLPNQDLLRLRAMEPAPTLQPKIRLQVRPYRERQGSQPWDVIADFLDGIGAQPPSPTSRPLAFNPSISIELFSVVQDINKIMPALGPQGEYNRLRHHLHDAIENYRWTAEDHPFSLSQQDVDELWEQQATGLQQLIAFCRAAAWIDLAEGCAQMQPASNTLKILDIPGSVLDYKPDLSRAYYVNLICHLWSYLRRVERKGKGSPNQTTS